MYDTDGCVETCRLMTDEEEKLGLLESAQLLISIQGECVRYLSEILGPRVMNTGEGNKEPCCCLDAVKQRLGVATEQARFVAGELCHLLERF